MKNSENKALFELVRTAPTELSQEQVMQLISTLPALPPPGKPWFKNINLNSIIMTTTTIAIITSAVIYFSSPKADPQLQGQELTAPAATEQPVKEEILPTVDSSKQTTSAQPIVIAKKAENKAEPALQPVQEQEPETSPAKARATLIEDAPVPATTTNPGQTKAALPSAPTAGIEKTAPPAAANTTTTTGTETSISARNNATARTKPVARERKINELKLKRLKRTLLKELTSDYLIQSKRSFMVLEFKADEIFVNDKRLDYAEFSKYTKLLYKFRVAPGPEKRIVTSPKFIMVGDFTDKGFKGSAQGKAVEIKFFDGGMSMSDDLFGDGSDSSFNKTILDLPEGQDETGDLFIKTEGRVKDAEVNVSLLDRMLSEDTSGIMNNGDGFEGVKTFKNAVTIFEKGRETTTAELSSKQIKSFKKELYKNLVADNQITTKTEPVVMLIGKAPFKVNENAPLNGNVNSRYLRLLQKYGLTTATHRRVVMNQDFIMIGDFEDGRFIGTVRGTLNSDKVRGTRVEEALAGYSVFGDSYHLSSEEGIEIGTKLKTSEMKALKETLYQYMTSDGYIVTSGVDVIFHIETTAFQVDNMNALNAKTDQKYRALLNKYKIKTGPGMKILMARDFLLVGQFREKEFNGSLQGMLEQERIIGSKFEPLLRGIDINLGDGMTYRINAEGEEAPDLQREERDIAEFNKLEVSGLAVVYLTQGPHSKARLEVAGMDIQDVTTVTENGVLKIGTAQNNLNNEQIAVHISTPDITSVEVTDAGEVFGMGKIKAENLKIMSRGSGAVSLEVDTYRLHLEMDGGDIEVEGQAQMEKVDFLKKSDAGTIIQSKLNVVNNWIVEGGSTWNEQGLTPLQVKLAGMLSRDGLITTKDEHAAITFFSDALEVNDQELKGAQLEVYAELFKEYGISLRNNRRLWLTPSYLILADKNGTIFEMQIKGTDLEFNIEGSWNDLEQAVLGK